MYCIGIFDSAETVDIELGYAYSDKLDLVFGVRNLFDEQGYLADEDKCGEFNFGEELGLRYSQFAPFGFNGTFFYGKMMYNF